MSDLISRSALIADIKKTMPQGGTRGVFLAIVDDQPAIEAVPVERNKIILEFAHELKEAFNRDIPLNYESTEPYFTLENARLIVDDVADQLIRNL